MTAVPSVGSRMVAIIRKSSCEIPEAGHRAFRVYYVSDPGRLQGVGRAGAGAQSALVTGRTLFCIDLIGGNARHVVALNAHAVKNGARDGRELSWALRCR